MMESQLKTNVGNLIGSNKKLKGQLSKKDEQIAMLMMENQQMKQGMYKKILKGDIEKHLDFVDATKHACKKVEPLSEIDEEAEILRQLAEVRHRKAQQEASKHMELQRNTRLDKLKNEWRARAEKIKQLTREVETETMVNELLSRRIVSVEKGEEDADIKKELGHPANPSDASVQDVPRTRTKSSRIPWELLERRPIKLRFHMKDVTFYADIQGSQVVCCQTKKVFNNPSAWCSDRTSTSGNGTSKSIYAVGWCVMDPKGEWIRLAKKEDGYDWNFK